MLEGQLLLGDRVKLIHLTASGKEETQAGTESKTIVTIRRRLEMVHGGTDAYELSTSIITTDTHRAEKKGEHQPQRLDETLTHRQAVSVTE